MPSLFPLRPTSAPLLTLVLAALPLFAACSSNTPPDESPQPSTRTGQRGRLDPRDSLRRTSRTNTVIENSRPDAPARAGVLVVANQDGASATVLDASTLATIATVPVGVGPHEVAVSPDERWAVVTNYGNRDVQGNTLSVIDLAAPIPVVARTIDLGEYHRPHGAAFFANGTKLAVTSETSQRLVLVDFASGKVDTALATNARGSHMVTLKRDARLAWTANIADSSVTEFDLAARRTVRTFPAAPSDEGIATTPGGLLLWVGSNTAKTVTVFDMPSAKPIATLTGFGFPYRIGISRTGRVAVVNDPTSNKIWIYDVGSRRELAQIDLSKAEGVKPTTGGQPGQTGAGPEGITFDPIADIAYVTLHGTNQVAAVDLSTYKVIGAGAVGAGPDGIAYSPIVRQR